MTPEAGIQILALPLGDLGEVTYPLCTKSSSKRGNIMVAKSDSTCRVLENA